MGFGGRTTEKITGINIVNNGFYPDIDAGDFQEKQRINTEYRVEAIKNRLQLAMIYVNRELKEQKAIWKKAGFAGLASVSPDDTIGTQSADEIIYLNAVYSHAKAYLLQDYTTMNRRAEAENENKEASATFESYMADCHDAIKGLTGDQGTLEIYEI